MTFEFRNWDEEHRIHVLLDVSYSSCKNNIKQKPIQKNFQRRLAKIGHYGEIGMKGSISKIYWRVMQILFALFLVAYYQVVQFAIYEKCLYTSLGNLFKYLTSHAIYFYLISYILCNIWYYKVLVINLSQYRKFPRKKCNLFY